ncbi:MAG: endonuclease III [Actinobacteria bacterium]|nr:endonuclease III [Actinomycetota bacterium]
MKKNYGKTYTEPYEKAVKNIDKIIDLLSKAYPEAITTSLRFKNPFELLIATILAAQSTDKIVNKVTSSLFQKYKTPYDFANANLSELQEDIKSTGFFRNKSIAIIQCSKDLIEKFEGKVPDNIEDLIKLHGVGRKTANVVIANAFGKQGIIVDTHMLRIANLIGLTINKDATKVEFDLQKIIPYNNWTDFSHKIVEHGRNICIAGRPECEICPISDYCRYYNYLFKKS